jgi:YHS domain-containing protein
MLLRLIVFAVISFFAYLLVRRTLTGFTARATPRREPEGEVAQLVQDPQCGIYVTRGDAVQRKVPGGLLFFCSERCAEAHMHAERKHAAP